jgi:RNA polymerase-binding transcription factor
VVMAPSSSQDNDMLDLEYFRAKLLARRDELENLLDISRGAGDPVKLDQTAVGRLSRMDAMQAQAMAQETERRRHQEISSIEAALKRMDEGEYGYCLETGELIPRARLELNPAAATAVLRKE